MSGPRRSDEKRIFRIDVDSPRKSTQEYLKNIMDDFWIKKENKEGGQNES